MSDANGWVKIYRKMLDNPVITKSFAHMGIWLYLLLHAAHKETDVLFSGKRFTIQAGQLVTTRSKLCSLTLEERLTPRQVRTILEDFEREKQITKESRNGTGGGMIITITRWADFQTDGRLATELINGRATVTTNGGEMPTNPTNTRETNGENNGNQTAERRLESELSTPPSAVSRPFSDRQNKNIRNKENNNIYNNIYNTSPAATARAREEEPPKAPDGFEYSGRDPETGKPLYRKLNPTDEDIDAFFEYFRQHPETKIILRSEEEIKQ